MPLSQSLTFYQQIETAANDAFAQARWHDAVMHYQQAINLNQQDADLHYRLAQSLYELDNFDNAILACQQAIQLDAQFADAHKLLGDLLLKNQKLFEANQAYQEALALNPDLALEIIDAYQAYANVLALAEKWIEAEQVYQLILQLAPEKTKATVFTNIADLLKQQNRWIEAANVYKQAAQCDNPPLDLTLKLVDALAFVANEAEKEAQIQQAEHLYKAKLKTWLAQHKGLEAANCCREIIALNPKHQLAHFQLGQILSKLKRVDEALTAYDTVLTLNPNPKLSRKLSKGYKKLGEIFRKQAQIDKALHAYQTALKLNPTLSAKISRAYQKWANELVQQAQWQQAERIYYEALELTPDQATLFIDLGDLFAKQQLWDLAIDAYRNAEQDQSLPIKVHLKLAAALCQFSKQVQQEQALWQKKALEEEQNGVGQTKKFKLPPIVGAGNDYSFIAAQRNRFITDNNPFHLPVSVIISVYNCKDTLAKTLAALTHQTYPLDLIEIVIADDGSTDELEEVIEKYGQFLNIRHAWQPDNGYQLAAIRNIAIQAAKHQHLIFLECEMLPTPQLIEQFMAYLHITDKAVLMGHHRFVCTDELSDDAIHQDSHLALNQPDSLPQNDVPLSNASEIFPFTQFRANNCAVTKAAINQVGLFDEAFQASAYESEEVGYRFYNAGYYFIPVFEALALYQERPHGEIEPIAEQTRQLIEQKCPIPKYRSQQNPNNRYEVPKVSIYMPAYNAASYIKEAIDSALNQSYSDLEICIVDDGSTDNTSEILMDHYLDHPKVSWLRQPHGGIAQASNLAVRMCKGMYIGQLDADDFLEPDAVATMVDYLDNHDVACVYGRYTQIDNEGKVIEANLETPAFSREQMMQGMIVSAFRLFRKRDWMRTECFNESLSSAVDYDMFMKLSEIGHIHPIEQIMYTYRWHDNNVSQHVAQKSQNALLVVNKALTRLKFAQDWEAYYPDLTKPEAIELRKKHKPLEKQQDKLQVPSQANWKVIAGQTIEGFPSDLRLPPIIGNGNDYSFIDMQLRQFITMGQPYTLPVSIIIPVYNRKIPLAKTLAALTHQTYPAELIEIIVADDGSSDGVEEVIEKYQQHLTLKHVYQADLGYRLAAVRNLGIKAAMHDCLIILDSDMLPVPNLVESFMQYLQVTDQALLIGHRRFVCTDDINDDDILADITVATSLPDIISQNVIFDNDQTKQTLDWRLNIYQDTDYLKEAIFPASSCVGCNIALTKKIIHDAGYFDEDFQAWGGEDGDWGFRIYNAGYYFIPVLHAVGLHQEPLSGKNEIARLDGREKTNKILEDKCPIVRQYQPHRVYSVPKVSIYIPAYNAGKYIKEAVDSALAQTYTDLEVCLVDDGSTDNTLRVIENHYQNNPRVRWLTQQNGGIGKASNAAIRLCRGVYIGQLDADDILKPDAVKTMVDYLDNHNVGCVYGSSEMIDATGNYIKDSYNWPVFSREKLMGAMIVHPFRMFRKRDWLRTPGFNEELKNAVDFDMFLKLSEVCTIHHLDNIMYGYRWHGENTSIIHKTAQFENHVQFIRLALERLGLDQDWEVYSPHPENIRKVEFRKKNKGG
ncbi:MAG TPA: glycosyltransferase [Thiotrichaceae bacterium]|nr:glycosyltransferase [Thiotrichaceae bacterium]